MPGIFLLGGVAVFLCSVLSSCNISAILSQSIKKQGKHDDNTLCQRQADRSIDITTKNKQYIQAGSIHKDIHMAALNVTLAVRCSVHKQKERNLKNNHKA